MVSANVNRCCPSCTEAGFTLAQSQNFHAIEQAERDRSVRRDVLWLGAFLLVLLFLVAVVIR